MLEVAKCRECGEVKPCISFRWVKLSGESGVNHYCPECDDAIGEWLDISKEIQVGFPPGILRQTQGGRA